MSTMDVRYINPFLKAVGLVFRTMADVAVSMGEPYLKDTRWNSSRIFTVSVVINLTGRTIGIVSMRFCKPVVQALVKALTGNTPESVDADCMDALGEVANMVVGNAKAQFPACGTSISTPKVCTNDPLNEPPILVLPFDCVAGRFLVEVRLRSNPSMPEVAQKHLSAVDIALQREAERMLQ